MAFFHVFFVLMACIGGLTALVLVNYMVHIILAKHPNKDSIQRTNSDRIRGMSDSELAEFLLNRDLDVVEKSSKAVGFTYKVDREPCLVNVLEWLKQEASE